jgi:hypothetical protein
MLTSDHLSGAIRNLALIAVAILAGAAVAMATAVPGHEFLVLTVGEGGIPAIDDTPLMFALVAGAYLAGGISGMTVLVFGWARYVRSRS